MPHDGLDDSALRAAATADGLPRVRFTDADSADVFREVARLGLQALVEAEATTVIGAERHERTRARTTRRNGGRQRVSTAISKFPLVASEEPVKVRETARPSRRTSGCA